MNLDRRQFGLGLAAAMFGLSASAQDPKSQPSAPSAASHPPYFFKHPTFEMIFLTSLGRAYHSGGNVGKVLYLTRQVEDGDFEGAYLAFKQAGDEARALAEESASHGHRESAPQAHLWAQHLYHSSSHFVG